MPMGTEPDILLNLLGSCDGLFKDEGEFKMLTHCVQSLPGMQPEAKTQ